VAPHLLVRSFAQTKSTEGAAGEGRGGCTEQLFIRNFSAFDRIVTPSGSCTHHLRNKFTAAPDSPERRKVSVSVYDLVEFLHDVLQVRKFPWARFNHKVALHTSCSAIRGLGMASMSERVHDATFSKPKTLLESVPGIQFCRLREARRMLRLRRNVLRYRGSCGCQDGIRQDRLHRSIWRGLYLTLDRPPSLS
jgi:hypothetical protein